MVAACSRKATSVVDIPLNAQSLDSYVAASVRRLRQEVELKHWRGVTAIFAIEGAPVLDFHLSIFGTFGDGPNIRGQSAPAQTGK